MSSKKYSIHFQNAGNQNDLIIDNLEEMSNTSSFEVLHYDCAPTPPGSPTFGRRQTSSHVARHAPQQAADHAHCLGGTSLDLDGRLPHPDRLLFHDEFFAIDCPSMPLDAASDSSSLSFVVRSPPSTPLGGAPPPAIGSSSPGAHPGSLGDPTTAPTAATTTSPPPTIVCRYGGVDPKRVEAQLLEAQRDLNAVDFDRTASRIKKYRSHLIISMAPNSAQPNLGLGEISTLQNCKGLRQQGDTEWIWNWNSYKTQNKVKKNKSLSMFGVIHKTLITHRDHIPLFIISHACSFFFGATCMLLYLRKYWGICQPSTFNLQI